MTTKNYPNVRLFNELGQIGAALIGYSSELLLITRRVMHHNNPNFIGMALLASQLLDDRMLQLPAEPALGQGTFQGEPHVGIGVEHDQADIDGAVRKRHPHIRGTRECSKHARRVQCPDRLAEVQ